MTLLLWTQCRETSEHTIESKYIFSTKIYTKFYISWDVESVKYVRFYFKTSYLKSMSKILK